MAKAKRKPAHARPSRALQGRARQPEASSVVSSVRGLAATLGKAHSAVQKWLDHPAWPFGRQGPWSVEAVRAWALSSLQPDRAAWVGTDPSPGGKTLKDLPLPVQVELNLKIKRAQLLDLERKRLEGKLHDVQACRHRRLRQIHAVKGRLLDLGRSVAPLLEGKDRAAIQALLDERTRAMLEAFAHGETESADEHKDAAPAASPRVDPGRRPRR